MGTQNGVALGVGGEGGGMYLKILEKALKTVAKIWRKNMKNEQHQKLM